VAADAALRVLHTVTRSGHTEHDLRAYVGASVRTIEELGSVCIPEDWVCTQTNDYDGASEPTARAGLLIVRRRTDMTLRIDLGYEVWRPWGIRQHDLRATIGIGR
jgi:hypothetical protein